MAGAFHASPLSPCILTEAFQRLSPYTRGLQKQSQSPTMRCRLYQERRRCAFLLFARHRQPTRPGAYAALQSTRSTAAAIARCDTSSISSPVIELDPQWAKTNPPAKNAGYNNQGWPGCCRPPTPSEVKHIPAADWKAVSIVHHVPIPADLRALLDRAAPTMRTQSGSPTGRSPTSPNVPGKAMPQLDRRNSNPSPNQRP